MSRPSFCVALVALVACTHGAPVESKAVVAAIAAPVPVPFAGAAGLSSAAPAPPRGCVKPTPPFASLTLPSASMPATGCTFEWRTGTPQKPPLALRFSPDGTPFARVTVPTKLVYPPGEASFPFAIAETPAWRVSGYFAPGQVAFYARKRLVFAGVLVPGAYERLDYDGAEPTGVRVTLTPPSFVRVAGRSLTERVACTDVAVSSEPFALGEQATWDGTAAKWATFAWEVVPVSATPEGVPTLEIDAARLTRRSFRRLEQHGDWTRVLVSFEYGTGFVNGWVPTVAVTPQPSSLGGSHRARYADPVGSAIGPREQALCPFDVPVLAASGETSRIVGVAKRGSRLLYDDRYSEDVIPIQLDGVLAGDDAPCSWSNLFVARTALAGCAGAPAAPPQ